MKPVLLVCAGIALLLGGCAKTPEEAYQEKTLELIEEAARILEKSKTVEELTEWKDGKPPAMEVLIRQMELHQRTAPVTSAKDKEAEARELRYAKKVKSALRHVTVWQRVLRDRARATASSPEQAQERQLKLAEIMGRFMAALQKQ